VKDLQGKETSAMEITTSARPGCAEGDKTMEGPKYNYWVCFLDDDEHELERFERVFGPLFHVRVGKDVHECTSALPHGVKPHLWVLDLYYPQDGEADGSKYREEMNRRFAELEQKRREFKAYLQTVGQGPKGGLQKLKECRERDGVPVIMFTRKGTMEDAIASLDSGAAAVLKKPMPESVPATPAEAKQALDEALEQNKPYLAEHFLSAIRKNSHWVKHKAKYYAAMSFLLGYLATKGLEAVWRQLPNG